MSSSTDEANEFIFVGGNGSLACVDSSGMNLIDKIELFDDKTHQSAENANIISISSSRLNFAIHLIVSISETGLSKAQPAYLQLRLTLAI